MKKENLEDNVIHNIEQFICPILEKLKRKGTPLDRRNIDLLEKSLRDITRDFGRKIVNGKWKLSQREIEICHMLKRGLTTKEVADLLSASVRTVEHHRSHIRKKLGLSDKKNNLVDYLRAL